MLEQHRVRVPMGNVLATANALSRLCPESIIEGLERHRRGDWGHVDAHDFQANQEALRHGGRLLSVYYDQRQMKFWIITDADRSVTTVLLPEDY
jgi:hypothetical protein